MKKEKRGGKRKGAGRKALKEKMVTKTFWLRPGQAEFIESFDNQSKLVRGMIDMALEKLTPPD